MDKFVKGTSDNASYLNASTKSSSGETAAKRLTKSAEVADRDTHEFGGLLEQNWVGQ
jgi:hypothetical protein